MSVVYQIFQHRDVFGDALGVDSVLDMQQETPNTLT